MGKYSVEIKVRRDPTSENSDLYKCKMDLFDNGKAEEFLLFVQNFKMMIEDLGTIATNTKLQYICTILHGKALHQFDNFYAQMESTTPTY